MTEQYTAKSADDVIKPHQLLSMSGLDFMQAVLRGDVAGAPIANVLNFRVHSVDPGKVVFAGAPLFEHCNPVGTVHGGWYGTVLDSCMACAIMTTVPKGSVYTTLEYKVNITRPIPIEAQVYAIGQVQHAGRSTGVANGEIRSVDDDTLYATGSTTCIIMKMS